MKPMLLAAALSFPTVAAAIPPVPPPPEGNQEHLAILSALPERVPAPDLGPLRARVAPGLQVWRDGAMVSGTAEAWLRELATYTPAHPKGPIGYRIDRDRYHLQADGGISVRERTWVIPPKDAQTPFYNDNPMRYVTYHIENGLLVRVVYGPSMDQYTGMCHLVQKAKAASPDDPALTQRLKLCD